MFYPQLLKAFKEIERTVIRRSKTSAHMLVIQLRRDVDTRTPTDTGSLKAGWRYTQFKTSPPTLAKASVSNGTFYAPFVERGSDKGSKPWPRAGPRTVESEGRIWSKPAVGGMVGPLVKDTTIDRWHRTIADHIFGA